MKLIFILLLNMFVQISFAGSQATIAIEKGIENVVTLPFQLVKGSIRKKKYNKLEISSEQKYQEMLCRTKTTQPILNKETSIEDFIAIQKKVQCDQVCSKTFDLLNRRPLAENSKRENSLAFRNGDSVSDKYEVSQGFCWGHSSVTSQFNRLAFFESEKKAPFDLHSDDVQEKERAVEYYKKLIKDITKNRVREIPGFANLHEFSSEPLLQSYFGDRVARAWAKRAISLTGLRAATKSKGLSKAKNEKSYKRMIKMLNNHQQPQIVFTYKNQKFVTHTVLVSHMIIENGKEVLCIRDNNYSPENNYNCRNRLVKKPNGQYMYNNYDLGGLFMAHNDEKQTVKQISKLQKRCLALNECI